MRARLHPLSHPRSRWVRPLALGVAVVAALGAASCGVLGWILASGPVSLDVATPWLTSALEERFGGQHRIEVGGTVLERDEDGRTALRLRDIVVRDRGGAVVATAPKADVGLTGFLTGNLRAERLSLIGAEMALRIERDGQVRMFAGGEDITGQLADAEPSMRSVELVSPIAPPLRPDAPEQPNLLAVALQWLRSLDDGGLDGRDLLEVGLRNGTIAIDDRRSGKQLNFGHINFSLTRLKQGGAALAVSSQGTDGPWSLNATVTAGTGGGRVVEAVARDISPKDILLALRLDNQDFSADLPLSGALRAEIGADGIPQTLQGRILAGAGFIGDPIIPEGRILIDEAQIELRWDASRRMLMVPIEVQAGPSRMNVLAEVAPPRDRGGAWTFGISRGGLVLSSLAARQEQPLMIDRVAIRGAFDLANKRFVLEQADLRGGSASVALSGALDFSSSEPRLMVGLAGTSMSASAFKRLWPAFVAPELRSWMETHLVAGTVERVTIAMNAPISSLRPNTPPLAADELAIDIVGKGVAMRPVEGLPPAKDAEVTVRVSGPSALVTFGRSVVDLPSGRRMLISGGTFEVPDIFEKVSVSNTRFRVDGAIEAVAEMIAMEPLRDTASLPFDAAGTRGTVSGQVLLTIPLVKNLRRDAVTYSVDGELTGFSAEKFMRGQRAEASLLKISATQNSLQIKGDTKIASTPANVDYRKARGDAEAELRVTTTLDDAARVRLGFDLASALTGPVPVKLTGRLRGADSRLAVEGDLTQTKIVDLLPGWTKPGGKPARVAFVINERPGSTRLEDFVLEGTGATVKGALELDPQGDILNANFPVFAVSDGDKASLKMERNADGVLKVVLRGDLYDGRGLVKTAVAGQRPESRTRKPTQDLELDVKLGAITGHHGEALRAFELKVLRRAGHIRSFALQGKLGPDGFITGDLRARGAGRQVMYVESTDAGALFRLTDTYPKIVGGVMSVAIDPPTTDNAPQDGLLNIRDFMVRGEAALERVASSSAQVAETNDRGTVRSFASTQSGVQFSRMRVEFTRSPGRFAIRDGVVWGPSIGATMDGALDYFRDEVRLRGTFVPAYGLNNLFSRLPVVGMLLGGGANEGLLGITYQVVGPPRAPVLQVNPISAVAPGFLRKLFEFRGTDGTEAQR
jgi:Protein of unknown function